MNIEIDLQCGVCLRIINEKENIYTIEKMCVSGYELITMCEDCKNIAHRKLRDVFPKTVIGLN